MEVHKLDSEELEYELRIRGYSAVSDEEVMRKLLRGLLKTGENNLENYVIQNPEKEISICAAKLRELKTHVDRISGNKMSDSYRKADTKLCHLLGRIDRITTNDEKLQKSRSLFLKTILYLMKEMEAKVQTSVEPRRMIGEEYNIIPVTRTLVVSNSKMLACSAEQNQIKKDEEVGLEIFSHQGVALKKSKNELDDDPISGTLSIVQYESGKCIEWKPTEVSFETENTDAEWESVEAVRRRTCSTSSNVENYHQAPTIKISMTDLRSYKIKHSGRQISLITMGNMRYSFLFQCGNSDSFICALRAILNTRRAGRSKSTYIVIGEREVSKLNKSFSELNIFPDLNGANPPNVWNFMRNLHSRPYETTMQTFSKLTDTLLYRTPEQRPVDAEVAELLNQSFHVDDNDKCLGSDFTIVEGEKNIILGHRPAVVRSRPLNIQQWTFCLDASGRIVDPDFVKKLVFKGGIDPSLRSKVWKYLLNYYSWNMTNDECEALREQKVNEYNTMKQQWQTISNTQEERFSAFRERKNLIEKDVNRTDRTLEFYAGENNPNLKSLYDILMTYVMYNFNLGYVQGMSDLLSPILYVMGNEVDAFWCFVGFMNRVYNNFDVDQAGIKKQLSGVQKLLGVVVPDLASYLNSQESANMFFCFRMLLVQFKREFILLDIMTLWEIIWTDLPCKNFHLLICIAILDMEKKELMKNGNGLTEILKYVNELSCKMDLNKIIIEAEGIYEQLKAAGDSVPFNIRQIVGLAPCQENDSKNVGLAPCQENDSKNVDLAPCQENDSENSDEESYNINSSFPVATSSLKNSDDNDSIIDNIEKVTQKSNTVEIGFEGIERAISLNYY